MSAVSPSVPSDSFDATIPSRVRDWLEVASVFLVIESVMWTEGRLRVFLYFFAIFWIVTISLVQHKPARELGIGLTGLRRAAWIVPAGATVALAILSCGYVAGTLHGLFGPKPVVSHIVAYSIWATLQQFIVQSFFFLKLERLLNSSRKAVIATALIFGLAHIPNPTLLGVCLIGGLLLTEMFRRYRNIYPLAIAHAVVALALAVTVPDAIHRHMRVGIGYLHYHQHSAQAADGSLVRANHKAPDQRRLKLGR